MSAVANDALNLPLVRAFALEDARSAGLLEGEEDTYVNFRLPSALVNAAKQQTGLSSTSELAILALAMLAWQDPVAAFFRATHGALGPDHTLDY